MANHPNAFAAVWSRRLPIRLMPLEMIPVPPPWAKCCFLRRPSGAPLLLARTDTTVGWGYRDKPENRLCFVSPARFRLDVRPPLQYRCASESARHSARRHLGVRNVSSIINTAFYHIWHENDGVSDSPWADAPTDPKTLTHKTAAVFRLPTCFGISTARSTTKYSVVRPLPSIPGSVLCTRTHRTCRQPENQAISNGARWQT